MIHPRTRVLEVSPDIGLGVFAAVDLPRGTITWAADPLDRVLTPAQIAAMPNAMARDLLDRYAWEDADGNYVLTWDNARFVNHSCAPNCISSGFGFEIAVRDIAAGEELTNDYAELGLREDETFNCLCGRPGCRGFIAPTDRQRMQPQWSSQVRQSLPEVFRVAQPLADLIPDSALHELRSSLKRVRAA